jgi:multicomponent Na+:H+ antiporter subunit D
MLLAMGLGAFLCIFIGSYPWLLYSALPFPVDYEPFDGTHVLAQLQLLFFSAAAFTWLKLSGIYPPELHSTNLDAEWLYRRFAPRVIRQIGTQVQQTDAAVRSGALRRWSRILETLVRHHGPQGILARTWPTGSMVLWVAVLLGASLVMYYL